MDDRNNRPIPQDRQNQEINVVPQGLHRFVQDGVTPEQFAENARRLETFSRMNAMALQVHLQREAQQAEQRRQDELRLIQLAQQLAAGSQQQRHLPLPPPAPQPLHHHHPVPPQQPIAYRNAPVHGQSYNNANINNAASQHWSYMNRARETNVQQQHQQQQQQQQHRPSVSAPPPFGIQGTYSSREANSGSHQIGQAGVSAGSSVHTFQNAQPPNGVRSFVNQAPQFPQQYTGVPATSPQTSSGHASAPGRTANSRAIHPPPNLHELYASWVTAYGDVKAGSMAEEYVQSWKPQTHPTTSIPHSTAAPPAVSMSAQNFQHPRPFQVSKPEGVAVPPPPPPRTQEWKSYTPAISAYGRQTSSQHAPAAPSLAPLPHTPAPASELTTETNGVRLAQNTGGAAGAQSQHPEATPSSRVDSPTDHVPTLSAPPGSQSNSKQSILLASDDKGTALYSMRGLAASIKRSLNAERLAASVEPPASSDQPSQERKSLNSIEAIDSQKLSSIPDLAVQSFDSEAGTHLDNLITEPVDSPPTIPPASFSHVSIPHEETIHTTNDSSPSFTPYSTLTGAVSFDNTTDPVSHNPVPSTETNMTTSQPSSQIPIVHVEDPLISDQPSFEHLSFPHRTPTPPLVATITIVDDDDQVDEKAKPTASSRPSTPLHEVEMDSQIQYIPSGDEDDIEMSSIPGEDDFPIQPDIASSEFTKAWDKNALVQEADAPTHQATSLDRPMEAIDVEEHPENERRRSTQTPDEQAPRQSTDSAETSSRGSLRKLARKSRGKQKFYIAVPPASEWVLQAKGREAARRAIREKAGQQDNKEYAECELATRLCLRHCHWSGCQAVLNSMYALKQHVRQHQLEVKPVGPTMTVSCRWKQCRMVCERSSLLLHLNRHIDKGVTCIYDDCDERFSRIQDLVEHEKVEHANDEPPPSAMPQAPERRSPVALPQTVPSYTTTTRRTSKPSITGERHGRLGPWTLGMIIGHPTTGPEFCGSSSALRIRRTARLTDKAVDVAGTAMLGKTDEWRLNCEFLRDSAEYDILEEPSVASSRVFGEVDTVGVTGEFYEGSGKININRVGTPWSGGGSESDAVVVEGLL